MRSVHPALLALLALIGATLGGCGLGDLLFTPPTDEQLAARAELDAPPGLRPWEEPDRKSPPGAYQPSKMWHKLVVLHTNDLQGQAFAVDGKGGLAQLAGEIARQRRKAELEGASVLLLDAGDVFSGTSIEGDRGEAIVDWMNKVGYDAWTVGVQDYEHGATHLEALAQRAQFPLLGANIRHQATGRPPQRIQAFHVFTRGPLKVAVVGLVTPRANELVSPARRGDHTFADTRRSLKSAARWLRDRKIHATVLLNHQGIDEDVELAESLRDATLVVSGASETSLETGGAVGKGGGLLLASTAGRARCLGKVELTISATTGALLDAQASVIDLSSKATPPDREVARWLDEIGGAGADQPVLTLARRLGREPLGAGGASSCILGNAIADAMLAKGKARGADLALFRRASMQADLKGGPLTRRELAAAIAGVGSKLVVAQVKGSTLMALVADSLRTADARLEVSAGVTVLHDMTRPASDRLSGLKVSGDVNRARTYRVVLTERLAGSAILQGVKTTPLDATLRDALVAGLSTLPPAAQLTQQRLRAASGAAASSTLVGHMMLPDAQAGDVADARALYGAFDAYWGNWRSKGRLEQDATPGSSVAQLTTVGARVGLVLCVGGKYLAPAKALAVKHPRTRFLVVSTTELKAEGLPSNVTVVRVAKETIASKAVEAKLLGLVTGKTAGGTTVDLRK